MEVNEDGRVPHSPRSASFPAEKGLEGAVAPLNLGVQALCALGTISLELMGNVYRSSDQAGLYRGHLLCSWSGFEILPTSFPSPVRAKGVGI